MSNKQTFAGSCRDSGTQSGLWSLRLHFLPAHLAHILCWYLSESSILGTGLLSKIFWAVKGKDKVSSWVFWAVTVFSSNNLHCQRDILGVANFAPLHRSVSEERSRMLETRRIPTGPHTPGMLLPWHSGFSRQASPAACRHSRGGWLTATLFQTARLRKNLTEEVGMACWITAVIMTISKQVSSTGSKGNLSALLHL